MKTPLYPPGVPPVLLNLGIHMVYRCDTPETQCETHNYLISHPSSLSSYHTHRQRQRARFARTNQLIRMVLTHQLWLTDVRLGHEGQLGPPHHLEKSITRCQLTLVSIS